MTPPIYLYVRIYEYVPCPDDDEFSYSYTSTKSTAVYIDYDISRIAGVQHVRKAATYTVCVQVLWHWLPSGGSRYLEVIVMRLLGSSTGTDDN